MASRDCLAECAHLEERSEKHRVMYYLNYHFGNKNYLQLKTLFLECLYGLLSNEFKFKHCQKYNLARKVSMLILRAIFLNKETRVEV